MARSVQEAAHSFHRLALRIEEVWPQQVPKETTFKTKIDWTQASLTPLDAISLAKDIEQNILDSFADGNPSEAKFPSIFEPLIDQAEQIDFVNFTSNVPSVIRSTFDFLYFVKLRIPAGKISVDWDKVQDDKLVPKKLSMRLRALEARLSDLEPRAEFIEDKISVVESAHDAAERLPTDLEELRNARDELNKILDLARKAAYEVDADRSFVESNRQKVVEHEKAALLLVQKCDEAYRITTSAGLAGAFEHRSTTLAATGWIWVVILMISLGVGGWLGVDRLNSFKSLLLGEHSAALVSLNILVAIVGVAAPVWLAWLATRSIGQSFRLSEDYAFKSAVSKAYEGYRKEAVNLDEGFARRLFGSALDRLDEAPSRFIVSNDHNSPLEALLANPEIKDLMSKFPDLHQRLVSVLIEQKTMVTDLISGGVASVASVAKATTREPLKDDKSTSE